MEWDREIDSGSWEFGRGLFAGGVGSLTRDGTGNNHDGRDVRDVALSASWSSWSS